MKSNNCIGWLIAVAVAGATATTVADDAENAPKVDLAIERKNAGAALVELGESAGIQIAVPSGISRQKQLGPITGSYTVVEALDSLLKDTGLAYHFAGNDAVAIGLDQDDAPTGGADPAPQAVDEADDAEEDPLELVPQKVTGTRLRGGDPSAQVYSFTAEDISRRGVSNLEEFFRKMPWTFPSMTTQTYNEGGGNEVNRGTGPDFDAQLFGLGLGVSTVNLRGMGSPNTLVLLNGRRLAGTGGQEADFVNLLNVPLSAIERVDVQLGGASAVYGSDAIGGVVNFITKRNYRGISGSYRQEASSTDADSSRASVTGGYTWNSGNATMVLSRSTSKPITNAKTGFSSADQRSIFGPEISFDSRDLLRGQPGVVCEMVKTPPPAWDPGRPPRYECLNPRSPLYYQLPPGHSGEGATVDDFETFNVSYFPVRTGSPWPLDEIAPQNGVDSTDTSLLLTVEQYINDSLRVYADINWSLSESYREYDRTVINPFIVPASNAWNPFGKHVMVRYVPIYESDNGRMPAPFDEAENENRTISFGFIWSFDALDATHEVQVDVNRTKSWRETSRFEARPTRSKFDPSAEAFYAALSSSDPNVALNFFGDGTAQGSAFDEFLAQTEGPYVGVNETREFEVTLRGELFDLWAGPIVYSVGGEYRENIIYSEGSFYYEWEAIDNPDANFYGGGSLLASAGVDRPTRDTQSFYAEVAVPLVNPDNALPAVNSLYLTLQARRDTNESQGSLGGLEEPRVPIRWWYWDPDEGFLSTDTTWPLRQVNPNLHTAKFGRTSPRVGIQYKPVSDLTLRFSWQRNYRAPTWRNQFGPREPQEWAFSCGGFGRGTCIDPFDPDGPTEIVRGSGLVQNILDYAPAIREEHSDNYSASFDWSIDAIPGLRWTLQWEKADFTDRIESVSGYVYDADTFPLVLENPQVAVRNERGDLVGVNLQEFNISEALNEMVSTQLEYSFDSPAGNFTPRVRYTRYLEDFTRIAPGQPTVTVLGTQSGNDEFRWEGSLTWLWNRLTADLFVYYTPGHPAEGPFCQRSDLTLPGSVCTEAFVPVPLEVSSLTTVDLTVTYAMDMGLTIRGGGRNILDREAPPSWFSGQAPYDPGRWDARGRVFFLELTYDFELGR